MSFDLGCKHQVVCSIIVHCTLLLILCQQGVFPPSSTISYLSQPRDLRLSRVEELWLSFQQLIFCLYLYSFLVTLLHHIRFHFLLVALLLQMILDQKQALLTLLTLL
jgi:hypothetical protein